MIRHSVVDAYTATSSQAQPPEGRTGTVTGLVRYQTFSSSHFRPFGRIFILNMIFLVFGLRSVRFGKDFYNMKFLKVVTF